jgi:hypothetical protein
LSGAAEVTALSAIQLSLFFISIASPVLVLLHSANQ